MSETIFLARIETASGVSHAGKNWTRWDFIDADNNKIGSTFQAALGNQAQAHIGGMVDVDRAHDGKGWKVTAVRPSQGSPQAAAPASSPATPAQPSTNGGQYFKPRDPKESRSIIRQVAIKTAAAFCAAAGIKNDQDMFALATRIESWIAREIPDDLATGGTDDGIPF